MAEDGNEKNKTNTPKKELYKPQMKGRYNVIVLPGFHAGQISGVDESSALWTNAQVFWKEEADYHLVKIHWPTALSLFFLVYFWSQIKTHVLGKVWNEQLKKEKTELC